MSGRLAPQARIAVVSDTIRPYDAISESIVDTWRFLTDGTQWDVRVFAMQTEGTDLPVTTADLPQMLLDSEFLSADLVIYHFAGWSPLQDAMLLGGGRVRQAVCFHNVTPVELAFPEDRWLVNRANVQINNLRCADRLWPVSQTNAAALKALDFDPSNIDIIPLAVNRPEITRFAAKLATPIELVFLGRIVPHKGLRDLVEAIRRISKRDLPNFRLRVLGNLDNSDRAYVRSTRQQIADADLTDVIEFLGTVDDATRDEILQASHILAIPSYHEGFCKPAIEGLRAGCIPVGYAAYHLQHIADGLCRMVAPGDIDALTAALAATITDAHAALADPTARLHLDRGSLTAAEFAEGALAHVRQFQVDRIAELMRQHVARLLTSPPRAPSLIGGRGQAPTRRVDWEQRVPVTRFEPNQRPVTAHPEVPVEQVRKSREGTVFIKDYPYFPRQRPFDATLGGRRIIALMEDARPRFLTSVRAMADNKDSFRRIPYDSEGSAGSRPYWINGMLPGLDGMFLYSTVLRRNPKIYFEIGSGHSTRFVRLAIAEHDLRTRIISVDPEPHSDVDHLCDEVIRKPFEKIMLQDYADLLSASDVVFVDGSHRAFQNSDVTIFFTELLPLLPSGLLYGIHDIFLPFDYPGDWADRFYNEQYLLVCYLLGGAGGDNITFPGIYVSHDAEARQILSPFYDDPYFDNVEKHAGAFWLEKK